MKKYFPLLVAAVTIILLLSSTFSSCEKANSNGRNKTAIKKTKADSLKTTKTSLLDTINYKKRMAVLSNGDTTGKWPVKTAYPLPGALLPYKRIIAFYGNLYSKRMGILGELPKNEMLKKLKDEVALWKAADTTLETVAALHYIAVTAQGKNGSGNNYRLRMPFKQIDTVMAWAKEIDALVFLDIQVGQSTVKDEIAMLTDYLKLSNVHLGIDPEFSMKNGEIPGSKIGTMSANDINDAITFLTTLVKENNLPPKVLIVHRFTKKMITDYEKIKPTPQVQVVIDMDGFGSKELKRATWLRTIYPEPVQFTGFKLFYKNDTEGKNEMYTPQELLQFIPKPIYIQYQ
ncbi:hypothetical protein [Flavobacterium sp.]|uniref:hypothetical protein n=1 Tax=Flavobacterium sp. TaxID=239 RepID=UPI003753A725